MNELHKNISEVLKDEYIIPLYQRNFAWGEEEITQLLQDIYSKWKSNKKGLYFIGSLVVFKRADDKYEVIDGQQRLTAITLIARILGITSAPHLYYDSRPKVEKFLKSFYAEDDLDSLYFDARISHLYNAVEYINNAKLTANDLDAPTICSLTGDEQSGFVNFISNQVILVRVEIPSDTDVASYFEIMNNRGEQLQKHEIIKALMISRIGNIDAQRRFARVWDACSQINVPIQNLFAINNGTDNYQGDRVVLFGKTFNELFENRIDQLLVTEQSNDEVKTIDEILGSTNEYNIAEEDKTWNTKYQSIIDFPNFLMHILKTYDKEVPLNDKYLLEEYNRIAGRIDSEEFVEKLLLYRTLFDKYIIKTRGESDQDEEVKWSIISPKRYESSKGTSALRYINTFGESEEVEDGTTEKYHMQERIIKAMSMLQVTFRQRIYKDWLFMILQWLAEKGSLEVNPKLFLSYIDHVILSYYNDKIAKDIPINDSGETYAKGTKTPHFIFNFIDYLYWVKDPKQYDFDFKYRNSVEHHMPQSSNINGNIPWVDNLGNLCLVSKSANSRMNNENPKGKASTDGKYYHKELPPKQKVIYDITNLQNNWSEQQVMEHYSDVMLLLSDRDSILNKHTII